MLPLTHFYEYKNNCIALFYLNIRFIYIRAQVDGEFWNLSHDSCLSRLCVLQTQHRLSRAALPGLLGVVLYHFKAAVQKLAHLLKLTRIV